MKIPFAAERLSNAIGDGDRLFGPLRTRRGSVSLPGPLPSGYLRNVPTLLIAAPLLIPFGLVATLAVLGPASLIVANEVAGQILLGGAGIFVERSVKAVTRYFVAGSYHGHSARSVLPSPFKSLFAAGLLMLVFRPFTIGLENDVFLVVLIGLKLFCDLRAPQLKRSETRGIFYHPYESKETETEPIPVEEPTGAPTY